MHGTWQTSGGGGGIDVGGLAGIVLLVAVAAGVAAAVETAMTYILIAVAALVAASIAALVAYRIRRPAQAAALLERIAAAPVKRLAGVLNRTEPAGIESAPAENHQHIHLHGLGDQQLAQILANTRRNHNDR